MEFKLKKECNFSTLTTTENLMWKIAYYVWHFPVVLDLNQKGKQNESSY